METLQAGLCLGLDIGSTTVKTVIMDARTGEIAHSRYRRHNAEQAETVGALLDEAAARFPDTPFRIAVCGSGGRPVAEALGARYIQEVVANAAAVRALYPQTRTAVELGGQDAKLVFFHFDEAANRLLTSDMRMNGSCAGGTGAFIDEIATLLNVPAEGFEALAAEGKTVYDISGRCGVFAKTDIQPLLIQGAPREDIALSTFHAIVKQTVGGLAQGLELTPPIVFEGGPLTFNPTLVRVFAERLGLGEDDIIIPEHPETIVAHGAAIALGELFPDAGDGADRITLEEAARRLRTGHRESRAGGAPEARPFFATRQEREAFMRRHGQQLKELAPAPQGGELRGYLGIDSGSTTSKFVLMDEDGQVVDRFYSNNQGDPIRVVQNGLIALREKYERLGVELNILGLGTTGYGRGLFAEAFGADYHTVETIAHAQSCRQYIPDVSFLLDVGGQDMKAIWLRDGIATNIVLNEACSSGCGSFLESFAVSLGIPADEIAEAAFRSTAPASLGSRCTVFMNSTIISEQRNGKKADDIMAGLCRSIVENIFTKVIRVANLEELGDKIVVQGGTFLNFAVLRALEEYLGKEVILAPYPGEMGALGAAICAKRHIEEHGYPDGRGSAFIGLDALDSFDYRQEGGVRCGLCANHCSRTVTTFSTGRQWVTGNRCERGAAVTRGAARPESRRPGPEKRDGETPDLFRFREKRLLMEYPCRPVAAKKNETIGLPRALEFWDSMPFWTTFFRALGYDTKISGESSHRLYEQGLQFVSSDTICFPAKLVHGHIQDLAGQGVDRIFMPYVMHMPPEGVDKLSPYVCPVIMGYPMVVRNFQSPERRLSIPFDTPVFHWFSERDREVQIWRYAIESLGATEKEAKAAYSQARAAIHQFRAELVAEGQRVLDESRRAGKFAVVLAGRPYHTDPFICHNVSRLFTERGIPVLTVDALPGLEQVDLRYTRAEITNDFHTRMLSGAMLAASEPALEYVQIVSFGCGHDAILSDEITRIGAEVGGKAPLILKLDESDAAGALKIRVQSFIETVDIRRSRGSGEAAGGQEARPLPDPYGVKFYKKDKPLKTVIIPNISGSISKILSAIMERKGFRMVTVPVGGVEEAKLGKKYTHNDICFPCQMVIGEAIAHLQSHPYGPGEAAVAMIKFQCDCRMSQYAGLLRGALDSAGFSDVSILATDFNNTKDMHPGVSILGGATLVSAVWGCLALDCLEDLRRKIRPYELIPGETERVFAESIDRISDALRSGLRGAIGAFKRAIDAFCQIPYDRSAPKPRVFVTGEVLVTFHTGSNFDVENYLIDNGMEAIFPRMTDQFRKDFLATISQREDFGVDQSSVNYLADKVFDLVQNRLEKIARVHPLYWRAPRPQALYEEVRDIIPKTLSCGEGWLIPAEIAHYAAEGVNSFVILQPFGCLPNHICGRGVTKRIKEDFPGIQILPIDLDPDTSYANVENRLQMLIMNEKSRRGESPAPEEPCPHPKKRGVTAGKIRG